MNIKSRGKDFRVKQFLCYLLHLIFKNLDLGEFAFFIELLYLDES